MSIKQALREALSFVSLSRVTNGRRAKKTMTLFYCVKMKARLRKRLKETESEGRDV